MTNAYRDENSVPTLIGVLSTDGSSIQRVKANATNHALKISDAATGTDHGPGPRALRDENSVRSLLCVSSRTATVGGVDYIQGVTPVAVYADSSGNLLVDHT